MSELRDLYQEVILDHNKRPRNFRVLDGANAKAERHNPLCGDRLTLYLRVEEDTVADATFLGSGCAISKASASIMTDAVKGKSVAEAEALFDAFHAMLTSQAGAELDEDRLGKLAVFAGVAEFPTRVKCATLAWHTLKAALERAEQPATTERDA